jgi:hypothetical protein
MNETMLLANDLFPPLTTGEKTITIRKGIRAIAPGPMSFRSTDPVAFENANKPNVKYVDDALYLQMAVTVTEVRYKLFNAITDEEARLDMARDVEDLYDGMKRFYPDLELDDPVTLIFFDADLWTPDKRLNEIFRLMDEGIRKAALKHGPCDNQVAPPPDFMLEEWYKIYRLARGDFYE